MISEPFPILELHCKLATDRLHPATPQDHPPSSRRLQADNNLLTGRKAPRSRGVRRPGMKSGRLRSIRSLVGDSRRRLRSSSARHGRRSKRRTRSRASGGRLCGGALQVFPVHAHDPVQGAYQFGHIRRLARRVEEEGVVRVFHRMVGAKQHDHNQNCSRPFRRL